MVSLYSWKKSASSAASASLCEETQRAHVGKPFKIQSSTHLNSWDSIRLPSPISSSCPASPPSPQQTSSPAPLHSPPLSSPHLRYLCISWKSQRKDEVFISDCSSTNSLKQNKMRSVSIEVKLLRKQGYGSVFTLTDDAAQFPLGGGSELPR